MEFGRFSATLVPGTPPFATVIHKCYNRDVTGTSVLAAGDIVMFDMNMTASVSATAADGSGTLPVVSNWGRGRDGVYGNVLKLPGTDTHNTASYAHMGVCLDGAPPFGPVRVMLSGECSVNLYSAVTSVSVQDFPVGAKVVAGAGAVLAPGLGKVSVGSGAGSKIIGVTKIALTALPSVSTSGTLVPIFFNGISGF